MCVQAGERITLPLKIQSLTPPAGYGSDTSVAAVSRAPGGAATTAAARKPPLNAKSRVGVGTGDPISHSHFVASRLTPRFLSFCTIFKHNNESISTCKITSVPQPKPFLEIVEIVHGYLHPPLSDALRHTATLLAGTSAVFPLHVPLPRPSRLAGPCMASHPCQGSPSPQHNNTPQITAMPPTLPPSPRPRHLPPSPSVSPRRARSAPARAPQQRPAPPPWVRRATAGTR